MNLKRTHLIVSALLAAICINAQDYTAEDTIAAMRQYQNKEKKNHQREFRNYWGTEGYFGIGGIIGPIKNSAASFDGGMNMNFGFKFRYQINPHFALVVPMEWVYEDYFIRNGVENDIFNIPPEIPPYTPTYEEFRYWAFGVGLGVRYNFDNRTSPAQSYRYAQTGQYIELFAYGHIDWAQYYDVAFNGVGNVEKTLRYSDYALYPFGDAGLQLSVGWNALSIWSRYRLTDCFNDRYSNAELPSFSLGLTYNLFSFNSRRSGY